MKATIIYTGRIRADLAEGAARPCRRGDRMRRRAPELRSSPRGAPRDARVAGTPLRGPRAANRGVWIPACAGMNGIERREFILALAGAGASAVAWPLAARAQQAGRTYRLGFFLPVAREAPAMSAFFDELRVHGFVEGQNLDYSRRF